MPLKFVVYKKENTNKKETRILMKEREKKYIYILLLLPFKSDYK